MGHLFVSLHIGVCDWSTQRICQQTTLTSGATVVRGEKQVLVDIYFDPASDTRCDGRLPPD